MTGCQQHYAFSLFFYFIVSGPPHMNTAYHAQRVNRPSFPWVKTFLFGFLLALFAVGLVIWLATGTGLLSLLRAYRGGTLIHIDQPTVVRQIQQLQRLETVSFTMDKIISGEHDSPYMPKFLVSDRLLLVVHGEVIGGVDLSQLQLNDGVVRDQPISLRLPQAQILLTPPSTPHTHTPAPPTA